MLFGAAARRQAYTNPENTVSIFKNLMAQKYDDPLVQNNLEKLPYKIIRHSNGDAWIEIMGTQYLPS